MTRSNVIFPPSTAVTHFDTYKLHYYPFTTGNTVEFLKAIYNVFNLLHTFLEKFETGGNLFIHDPLTAIGNEKKTFKNFEKDLEEMFPQYYMHSDVFPF